MAASSRVVGLTIKTLLIALTVMPAMAPDVAMAVQLTASWTDNNGGIANTRVERRRTTEQGFAVLADVPPGTTSYVDTSVSPSTTYCYRLTAWAGTQVSPSSSEVCATSASEALSVSVKKAGTGSGTVVSSPAGIDCGATCSATYNAATSVTLTTTPAAASTFSGWSGSGCAGTAPCVLLGNATVTVTATFTAVPTTTEPPTTPTSQTLTVTKSGPGTVASTPAGIQCGPICSTSVPSGITVTLVASPNNKGRFMGWSGACAGMGTATSCTVTMKAAASVGATFKGGSK